VRHLHGGLLERGFAAVALSGELTQHERSQALQSLRDGRARVCVATDVAARGIDLPDLGLVIHADLPGDRETLLHRSGRTGRAGRKGLCVLLVPYTRRRRAEGLVASAHIDVTWTSPPSADQIRTRDQERLVGDPAFSEPPTDEDLALARSLLAQRSAEEIAAALVRFHRSQLPAPEEVFLADEERDGRAERRTSRKNRERPDGDGAVERHQPSDMVWFRMNIGRRNNADPRWLVPIICRTGHITKQEIGAIRIFDRETKFEIAASVAARFASAARRSEDKDIHIAAAEADHPKPKDGKRWNKTPRPGFKKGPGSGRKRKRG
jgi:ATP-dependent RNA helicase DeaD